MLPTKKRQQSEDSDPSSIANNALDSNLYNHSVKKVKIEGTIETEEITNPTVGDDNSTVTTTKTANSDKLTLEDMFNEDEYNEESDQDWASGDEGSESDSHDSVEEELLEHRAFQIPQPLNTTATIGADADNDVDVDGNDDDEAMYKLPWEPFTDQEMENIREEAKEKGLMKFIEKYVVQNETPVPKLLEAFNIFMHPQAAILASDKELLPILKSIVTRYLRKRSRLQTVNTLEDVANLLSKANNIMIVTGAGVSVSCGIPDFRSETGIYSRLQEYELDDPQQMFDIDYFRVAPEIFYSFAKELYPSNYEPSPSHHFVKLIEEKGKLLRNYTQNIDTLEHKANIKRVVNCHGSFATASCVTCGYKVDGKEIEEYIMKQQIPPCPRCAEAAEKSNISNNTSHKNKGNDSSEDDDDKEHSYRKRGVSIMKPDITFFGEQLPAEFDNLLAIDTEKVDLLIVMGSSLKVSPVSEIMSQMPHSVPQILVNRTPITHMTFDIQLLGDSDVIVPELCRMLKWDLKHPKLPGGSALSTESYKLSREGDGDEVEVTDSFNEKHKERKIWKYIKDGLYTFPGAVLDPKYISKERYDERGSLGSEDDNSIDNSIDEEEATANEVLGVANSDNVNDRNGE